MERNGQRLTQCDGATFGASVWCDDRSPYEVGDEKGTAQFFFHQETRNPADSSITIRCKKWRQPTKCHVRGKISTDGVIMLFKGVHNHRPEFGGQGREVYNCRGGWIRETRSNPRAPSGKTILKHRRGLQMQAAKQVIPERHARTARRHAAKSRPKAVRDRQQLHRAINSVNVRGYTVSEDNEKLLSFLCPSGAVVITTERQLSLLPRARMIHADATYKSCPRNLCGQLFTIHGNFGWQGHVEMALCAFMTGTKTEDYREVFNILKQRTNPQILTAYMGDFDLAMRSAVKEEFPDAHLYGCHFHFVQALVKRASGPHVGLAREIRKPCEELKKFIAFCAIPLLPVEDIRDVFKELAREAVETNAKFHDLTEYIESYWLDRMGPSAISVFKAPCRTNNGVESFNSKLGDNAGRNPSTWNLVSILNDFCHDSAISINSNGDGVLYINSRPSRDTVLNEKMIQEAWMRLEQGVISPRQFIDRVKYRHGGLALRKGLSDEEGKLTADVASNWDEWVNEQDALEDHDYDLTSMRHPFGDHGYATFLNAPEDRTPSRREACAERKPIEPKISGAMRDAIDKASRKRSDRPLVDISGHSVYKNDLATLDGTNWLNDIIMNAYLCLVVNRSRKNPKLPRVYTFDTYFLPLLEKDYAAVLKWPRVVDIFAHDLIFVPVHEEAHWTMVVIDLRTKTLKYMDSLGGQNLDCLETLLKFLTDELQQKQHRQLDRGEWHLSIAQNLPRQENGFDCGIFALKYAEYLSRDAELTFEQSDMPYFRQLMKFEILNSELSLTPISQSP